MAKPLLPDELWTVIEPLLAPEGPVAKFFRDRFVGELRSFKPASMRPAVEIRPSGSPGHNQKLGYPASYEACIPVEKSLRQAHIERIALDLIDRFGELAEPIARELATASSEAQDEMLLSPQAWQAIINTIEWRYARPWS